MASLFSCPKRPIAQAALADVVVVEGVSDEPLPSSTPSFFGHLRPVVVPSSVPGVGLAFVPSPSLGSAVAESPVTGVALSAVGAGVVVPLV